MPIKFTLKWLLLGKKVFWEEKGMTLGDERKQTREGPCSDQRVMNCGVRLNQPLEPEDKNKPGEEHLKSLTSCCETTSQPAPTTGGWQSRVKPFARPWKTYPFPGSFRRVCSLLKKGVNQERENQESRGRDLTKEDIGSLLCPCRTWGTVSVLSSVESNLELFSLLFPFFTKIAAAVVVVKYLCLK